MIVRSRADFIRDRDDSVVILLVDDELIEAELFRGLLEAEEDLEFHYCQRVDDALVHEVPQAIDYPMQLMLDIYEFPGERTERDVYPKEFVVDWVRGWS